MPKESPARRILRIGHRGACGHAPENTLASIEEAIALHCDLTELDVRQTVDGSLVLLHDARVDRTTNGTGPLAKMAIEDVQKLDAGGGQRIPTLEQALTVAHGRIGLILEFKTKGLAYCVYDRVRTTGFSGELIYASFLWDELQLIRQVDPKAKTLALFNRVTQNPVSLALRIGATHVGLPFDTALDCVVEALHQAHLQVFVYTVNLPADIARMQALGVDGIISDYPERIVSS
jgi:glycerophosphoryl diester phosphodiesterase